jgi:hypothetical protein
MANLPDGPNGLEGEFSMPLSIIALIIALFGFMPAHHHAPTGGASPVMQPMDGGGVVPGH